MKEKRGRFVERMKDESITVYSGRGMVVGCAGAGKTTLVKKLKEKKTYTQNRQVESKFILMYSS